MTPLDLLMWVGTVAVAVVVASLAAVVVVSAFRTVFAKKK